MYELKTKQDVLKVVKEKNVSFIQFWFTDVLGVQKIFGLLPDRGERHDRHA
jgi:glutamine synthetase